MSPLSYNSPILFDSRGHRRTASLFYEVTSDENMPPLYTLKDYDFRGLPSAYAIYMASADEYEAAIRLVGSMSHWRKLLQCKWFLHGDPERGITMGVEQWRQDMDARDASKARAVLIEKAGDGDVSAAKFLMQYATKGDRAGVKTASTKTKAPAPRRGAQAPGKVVDLSAAIGDIKQ